MNMLALLLSSVLQKKKQNSHLEDQTQRWKWKSVWRQNQTSDWH